MSQLSFITLTGADERTDLDALVKLVCFNPLVEVGLLYTATPEGRPRYPSRAWLREAAETLDGRCAIHVCGSGAKRELLAGELHDLTRYAPRVQLNGILSAKEVEQACRQVDTLITQHHLGNDHLLGVQARNHQLLLDGSGGRGISPISWKPPYTSKLVGFAGGLGPDTLSTQLPRIADVARDGAWVDMEGKLRVDDWFSVELAAECAAIFTASTTAPTPVTRPRRKP